MQRLTRGEPLLNPIDLLPLGTALILAFSSGLAGLAEPESSSAADSASGAKAHEAATGEHPDSTFDRERFTREVTKSKDLPNFHEVHPFLYRSGEPTEEGLRKAKSLGISTLIDLRGGDKSKQEASWAKSLGMQYINLPMSAEPPTKSQVERLLKTVKQAQAHPEKGAVLVHCAHGSDRTGCMIGIWRVTQEHWNYADAYKEMRHYWFTPKFTKLSGAVRQYASSGDAAPNSVPTASVLESR